ncbi:MAG: 16S rRNA (cytosine(1402)-N(4))-methyltransferase, partial [Bacillota bacterium]|nr:16S rRNA (cytosine(1402)-N(4))-methyltransferase [Bacillota bacterium]
MQPYRTTADLAGTIAAAMPSASRREAQHPARRSFQALRIAVNDELGVLTRLLETAPDRLNDRGRFCVITFHSLEDRLVKQAFRTLENPCVCPRDFPVCTCGRVSAGRVLTKRSISADSQELAGNPRSRSARLRCFERIIDRASYL